MTDILDPLIRDLVEWVAKEPRLYGDVLEAWRTSCPRLTVWEDAPDRGFVERRLVEGRGVVVIVTDAGRENAGGQRLGIRAALEGMQRQPLMWQNPRGTPAQSEERIASTDG